MNNPRKILETLDSFLETETRIVLFGRSSLALGFGDQGTQFGETQDVDAILPGVEMARIEADAQFWKAIDLTNKKLQPLGLYITHLFAENQVILTPDWLDKVVELPSSGYKFLRLVRPSSVDLILTKMMRDDREDVEDIRFILSHDRIDAAELDAAFSNAKRTEIAEIQNIFVKMQPTVREISLELGRMRENEAKSGLTRPLYEQDRWQKLTQRPSAERTKEKDRELEP